MVTHLVMLATIESILSMQLRLQLLIRLEVKQKIGKLMLLPTLRAIFDRYVSNQSVNFLKSDIKVKEFNALKSLRLSTLPKHQRPEVILFEVTIPFTQIDALIGNSAGYCSRRITISIFSWTFLMIIFASHLCLIILSH